MKILFNNTESFTITSESGVITIDVFKITPTPTAKPTLYSQPPLIVLPSIPPSPPSVVVPIVPYAVTGLATWFGQNPDGSDDKGDVDSKGHDLLGAFGDDTHNTSIVGVSIPIPIFHATIGTGDLVYADVAKRRWLFDVWCHSTGKHVSGAWLVDLGPDAKLNRPLDMTYALATLLGLKENAVCTWSVTDTQTGAVLPIRGWDFVAGKIA